MPYLLESIDAVETPFWSACPNKNLLRVSSCVIFIIIPAPTWHQLLYQSKEMPEKGLA